MSVFLVIGAAAALSAVIIGIIQHLMLARNKQDPSKVVRSDFAGTRKLIGHSSGSEEDAGSAMPVTREGKMRRRHSDAHEQAVILIVDDGITLRQLMAEMLRDRGYIVMEAGTGLQALKAAAERRPDCVLLDVGLPDMSGIEALRELRLKECHAPVVLMTGYMDAGQLEEANRIGFDRLLAKPFDLTQVPVVIGQLLDAELKSEIS